MVFAVRACGSFVHPDIRVKHSSTPLPEASMSAVPILPERTFMNTGLPLFSG